MARLVHQTRESWKQILLGIFQDDKITEFLDEEEREWCVFPPRELMFNAFCHFEFDELAVVIIGQDCYHGPGQANGLCFSVPANLQCPPSLRNIYKELEREYGVRRTNSDFTDWARQGVLLLNSALSVRESCAGSHLKIWKPYTRAIIEYIARHKERVVYILWGAHAQSYADIIDDEKNLVLRGIHPSPLAARSGSFVGCNHFKLANDYLEKNSRNTINWV